MQINICVIGMGNLAWSLIPALQEGGYQVVQLISRNPRSLEHYSGTYQVPLYSQNLTELTPEVDFILLSLTDEAIPHVIHQLPRTKATIIHHSGATPLSEISRFFPRSGVIYPLQSFTQSRRISFKHTPVFWESTSEVSKEISQLAGNLSSRVYPLDSQQRLQLHLGAVWVNNFTNMMYRIANQLLPQNNAVSFEVYEPIIRAHIEKIITTSTEETQSGPALRGDLQTLHKHLSLLNEQPQLQALYKEISELINPRLKDQW